MISNQGLYDALKESRARCFALTRERDRLDRGLLRITSILGQYLGFLGEVDVTHPDADQRIARIIRELRGFNEYARKARGADPITGRKKTKRKR